VAVEDVTLEILKGIQAGIATLSERVGQLDGRVNQLSEHVGGLSGRFDHLEAAMRKDRRNVAGMLVMMRATAGDFDARVAEVEERVAALEARAQ
jgi:uncharacterized protein YceH (UPF0502 family)